MTRCRDESILFHQLHHREPIGPTVTGWICQLPSQDGENTLEAPRCYNPNSLHLVNRGPSCGQVRALLLINVKLMKVVYHISSKLCY